MKRTLIALASAASVALLLAACEDGGSWGNSYGQQWGGSCSNYTSCDTCTPVTGCGWCTAPNGSGVCSPDPDDCPTSQFSWTWNSSGCRVTADASIGLEDATSPGEAGTTAQDAATTVEASVDSAIEGGCPRSSGDARADAPSCD